MSKISNVYIFSDIQAKLAEITKGAFELGEKVIALLVGDDEDVKNTFALGVHEVYHLGKLDPSRALEDYADTLVDVIKNDENAIFLMPNTKRCKALASIIGAKINAGVITEASNITKNDSGIECLHMVYGGLALGHENIKSNIAIVVVASGTFDITQSDLSKSGEAVKVDFIEPKNSIKCIERKPKQASQVDLNKAKRIVGIGRGIAKEEDIAIAQDLCSAIDAELGCSRPIAEAEKWMEHARYIGISGVMPKPELYLTIGISGQIQHMVGAKDSSTIVAINKDKNAPIFQYADYGIVGDLYKIIPAISAEFKH